MLAIYTLLLALTTPTLAHPPTRRHHCTRNPTSAGCIRATPWRPTLDTTWQCHLTGPLTFNNGSVTPDVDVYTLDLWDTPISTITALHNLGKRVICYFSAGTYESWLPDHINFTPVDKGTPLNGGDETYININSKNVRQIMKARIALAGEKGCDAIIPDNTDAFDEENGFGLTQTQTVKYIKFLSTTATSYGLSMGLKDSFILIPEVISSVAFSVTEECGYSGDCARYVPFIKAGKPVFSIEYPADYTMPVGKLCTAEKQWGFQTVLKNRLLDGQVTYCDGREYTSTESDLYPA